MLTIVKTADVLKKVREWYTKRPDRWIKGAYFKTATCSDEEFDSNGIPYEPTGACLIGATRLVLREMGIDSFYTYSADRPIADFVDRDVADFNDDPKTEFENVLAVLDKVIEKTEKEQITFESWGPDPKPVLELLPMHHSAPVDGEAAP